MGSAAAASSFTGGQRSYFAFDTNFVVSKRIASLSIMKKTASQLVHSSRT